MTRVVRIVRPSSCLQGEPRSPPPGVRGVSKGRSRPVVLRLRPPPPPRENTEDDDETRGELFVARVAALTPDPLSPSLSRCQTLILRTPPDSPLPFPPFYFFPSPRSENPQLGATPKKGKLATGEKEKGGPGGREGGNNAQVRCVMVEFLFRCHHLPFLFRRSPPPPSDDPPPPPKCSLPPNPRPPPWRVFQVAPKRAPPGDHELDCTGSPLSVLLRAPVWTLFPRWLWLLVRRPESS